MHSGNVETVHSGCILSGLATYGGKKYKSVVALFFPNVGENIWEKQELTLQMKLFTKAS